MRLLACIVWVAFCVSAQEVSPDQILFYKIKTKMEESLTRLPNYTCTETIERALRKPPARKFELQDVLRLEVALVNGRELFAWPGSENFDERPLDEIVNQGAIATGSFGLHARAIFMANQAQVLHEDDTTENGRKLYHFRYKVPLLNSGFHIKTPFGEATVAYHGNFWIDESSLELVRLQVVADEIPPQLRLIRSEDVMEYQKVRIGEGDFLLPQSSDLRMQSELRFESRNRTRFSRCRQFSGQSKLIFDEPEPDTTVAPAKQPDVPHEVHLPANLTLEVALDEPLEGDEVAVGDPVTAVLIKPVKNKKEILIPKGALVLGRIVQLSRRESMAPYFTIGLEFHSIRFENGHADFHAEFFDAQNMIGLATKPNRWPAPSNTVPSWLMQEPTVREPAKQNEALVYLKGRSLNLPKGLRLIWRTTAEGTK